MSTIRRVLAMDTSTTTQSIAVLQDGVSLATHTTLQRKNHGTTLLRVLDDTLSTLRLTMQDIDLIAVGLGPGSFTALRVGVANAKALSLGHDTPIIGVSSLAAMAYEAAALSPGTTTWAGVDARRDEIYAGAYVFADGQLHTKHIDAAYPPEALVEMLHDTGSGERCLWLGHKTRPYEALQQLDPQRVIVAPEATATPNARGAALLATALYLERGSDTRATIEPNYIRPSDAEQSLAKRLANAQG